MSICIYPRILVSIISCDEHRENIEVLLSKNQIEVPVTMPDVTTLWGQHNIPLYIDIIEDVDCQHCLAL